MELLNHYISESQSIIEYEATSSVESQSHCEIFLSQASYSISLPDKTIIQGIISSKSFDDNKRYHTLELQNKGYLFVFKDRLFLNLAMSQSLACDFYLDNYIKPSFSEQITNSIESQNEMNIELYGELGAYCIANNTIVSGVDVSVVLATYGPSKKFIMEDINFDSGDRELAIWFYDDKYVVFENAIVVFTKNL